MGVVIAIVAVAFLGAFVWSFFYRRHGERSRPEAGWARTDEVFRDPTTDRVMRVWVDQSGERHYVPDSGAGG